MNCRFRKADETHCECEVCGLRVAGKYPDRIHCECRGKRELSSVGKLGNYARAVTKHILSGFETRTDEEVSALLQICESCEFFTSTTCTVCGCRINSNPSPFTNKLRMKTQKCPKGKWE